MTNVQNTVVKFDNLTKDLTTYSLSYSTSNTQQNSATTPPTTRPHSFHEFESLNLPPIQLQPIAQGHVSLPHLPEVLARINYINSSTNSSALQTPREKATSTFDTNHSMAMHQRQLNGPVPPMNPYIAIGGINMKRPRRLHSQVNRIYKCIFPGCTKAYGALNHLNSHIITQKHGIKRKACEFYHLTRP